MAGNLRDLKPEPLNLPDNSRSRHGGSHATSDLLSTRRRPNQSLSIPRRDCSEYHGEVESSDLGKVVRTSPCGKSKENLLMRNRICLMALASAMLVGCGGTPPQKDAPPAATAVSSGPSLP